MSSSTLTWVVGSGGLLGGALSAHLSRQPDAEVRTSQIPWARPDDAVGALIDAATGLVNEARSRRIPWRIAWCAGAGVTGTLPRELQDETRVLESFLRGFAPAAAQHPGSLFFASSAGGVYAGSRPAPFSEADPTAPLSPYGTAKLRSEDAVSGFAAASGTHVLIGRIANLYGPGQNLDKAQGLISHICRAHLTSRPISIYVPLDTVRDYLFVDDCSALVADALDGLHRRPDLVTVKILASQQGTTIGALLGECHRVFKRRLALVLAASPAARFQAMDLRFTSQVWTELDKRALTPLPSGIRATSNGLLRQLQAGG